MSSFHAFVMVSAANWLSKIISAVKIRGYLPNSSLYAVKIYLSTCRRLGGYYRQVQAAGTAV